jgi:hypothetical protein
MSLRLPLADSPLRETLDLGALATLGTAEGRAQVPTFRQALTRAAAFLADCAEAKAVSFLCWRADGSLWLVEFTRRTWRKQWNFGNPVA